MSKFKRDKKNQTVPLIFKNSDFYGIILYIPSVARRASLKGLFMYFAK